MKLSDVKIGMRLATGFAVVLILMVLVTASGVYSMREIEHRLEDVLNNDRKMELLESMSASTHIVARVARTLVLLDDPQQIEREHRKITEARSRYDAARSALDKLPAGDAGTELLIRMDAARDAAREVNSRLIDLATRNQDAEATELLMRDSIPKTQQWQDALDEGVQLQRIADRAAAEAAREAYTRTSLLMLALTAIAVVTGGVIAWVITRSITRPLACTMSFARAIAAGDLTQELVAEGKDETAQLAHSLRDMNESLTRIVSEIRHGTDAIANASTEIASGNHDLSSRTEQQASSLEETAASMEEMTSTVKQNADNALQANQLARSATEVALRGGSVVAEVVNTMDDISASAKKIASIIGVIDDIAFQTNILALNAAVEAARAGEQGRGFAVVASEVRTLAQRSAGAAKEIRLLIGGSVEKVDAGARLVDKAGATMGEIVASIQRVNDIMNEIAASSREQASGIAQVNDAVARMDQVTQQNAALVEEAAAAAESLKDEAAKLSRSASSFKVGNAYRPGRTTRVDNRMIRDSRSSARVHVIAPRRPSAPDKVGRDHGVAEVWETY